MFLRTAMIIANRDLNSHLNSAIAPSTRRTSLFPLQLTYYSDNLFSTVRREGRRINRGVHDFVQFVQEAKAYWRNLVEDMLADEVEELELSTENQDENDNELENEGGNEMEDVYYEEYAIEYDNEEYETELENEEYETERENEEFETERENEEYELEPESENHDNEQTEEFAGSSLQATNNGEPELNGNEENLQNPENERNEDERDIVRDEHEEDNSSDIGGRTEASFAHLVEAEEDEEIESDEDEDLINQQDLASDPIAREILEPDFIRTEATLFWDEYHQRLLERARENSRQ